MIIFPLPGALFEPTEIAAPWKILKNAGYDVAFATPDGKKVSGDNMMATGVGLGLFKWMLKDTPASVMTYMELLQDDNFNHPIKWSEIKTAKYEGLCLGGGEGLVQKEFCESKILHKVCLDFFDADKPVAALCHGVLIPAWSISPKTGKSVLYGRKTTTFISIFEFFCHLMTLHLPNYLTWGKKSVQAMVTEQLAGKKDFRMGPIWPIRDSMKNRRWGFVVRDGNYISARWPGDAHHFGYKFVELLNEYKTKKNKKR